MKKYSIEYDIMFYPSGKKERWKLGVLNCENEEEALKSAIFSFTEMFKSCCDCEIIETGHNFINVAYYSYMPDNALFIFRAAEVKDE